MPFVHTLAKTYLFRGHGFHTPVEWSWVINKQVIIQILIGNTAFYIYGDIRLKEISIMNAIEEIQVNTVSGSAFSAQLGSGMKPSDRNPVTETRHRDQNFYPGLQD